ncbi:MAG: peptidylprolyl isomerase [Thermodesulfobacteriota bacterium]
MAQAKKGDSVKVHYRGTLSDGTEFDSSTGKEPLAFSIGAGMLIPAFESAVEGMEQGESKKVSIPAEEAYGPYVKELVADFERSQFPPDITPEVGTQLQIEQENGGKTLVRVIEVSDSMVTLDANHPLAGKDLIFDIELVEIAV